MRAFTFDASLETGDPLVDSQHRDLVRMFEELREASDRGDGGQMVGDALDRLTDFVNAHFLAEEQLMTRVGYGADSTAQHLTEHRMLMGRIREMVLDYRTGRLDNILPIVDFLYDWLRTHIREVDQQLADHTRERR